MVSTESFLHKIAKELLYTQIEKKGFFEWKTSNDTGIENLIKRSDYRRECILMEFPTGNDYSDNGMYPDEMGICKSGLLKHTQIEYGDNKIDELSKCECDTKGFRFNDGQGYCKCSQCNNIDYSKIIIHDIAVFWKGSIRFAIEIINKHPPKWLVNLKPMYPVYIIGAKNVLSRVSDSVVYVDQII